MTNDSSPIFTLCTADRNAKFYRPVDMAPVSWLQLTEAYDRLVAMVPSTTHVHFALLPEFGGADWLMGSDDRCHDIKWTATPKYSL